MHALARRVPRSCVARACCGVTCACLVGARASRSRRSTRARMFSSIRRDVEWRASRHFAPCRFDSASPAAASAARTTRASARATIASPSAFCGCASVEGRSRGGRACSCTLIRNPRASSRADARTRRSARSRCDERARDARRTNARRDERTRDGALTMRAKTLNRCTSFAGTVIAVFDVDDV